MNAIEVWDGSGYLPIPGTPGPQSFAHVGGTEPTARAPGDIWVNTEAPLVKDWDDDWQYPVLLNGWVDYGVSSYGSARYRKCAGGLVIVAGLIKDGTVGDVTKPAFILPDTHKPRYVTTMPLATSGTSTCRLIINHTQGYFQIHVGSSAWVSICCSFMARSEFE